MLMNFSVPRAPAMPRRCSICGNLGRDEIDQQLTAGRATSEIAAVQRVSDDTLGRHRTNYLSPEMREAWQRDKDLKEVDVLAEAHLLYSRTMVHLE